MNNVTLSSATHSISESLDQGKKPKRSSGKELDESEEELARNRRGREGQGWEFGDLGGKAAEREEKDESLAREKEGKEEKGEKQRAAEVSAIEERKLQREKRRRKERNDTKEGKRKGKGGEFDATCGGWPRVTTGRLISC